jgi:hypothetical protein
MTTSAVGVHVYESVRRRSPHRAGHRMPRRTLLAVWLDLVVRVVVVGGFAFGSGFVTVILMRAAGWLLAGNADAMFGLAAPAAA